jgi:hypothetical protein
MSQGLAPHVTPWQLFGPLHVTLHDAPGLQSTFGQPISVEHVISQLKPSGHLIGTLQVAGDALQLTMHVCESCRHDVHWAGQMAASGGGGWPSIPGWPSGVGLPVEMHSPSLQVRPSGQSAWVSHVNSLLL